jgi:hypothetical protein
MSLTDVLAEVQPAPSPVPGSGRVAPGFGSYPVIERRWWWRGYIPVGSPVVIAAKGGTGKGFLTAAVAARLVLGLPFPGDDQEERREPVRVLWITGPGEDDAYEDLAPRLRAAIARAVAEFGLEPELAGEGPDGAIHLVHNLSRWLDGGLVTIPADCPRIAQVVSMMNREADEQGTPRVGMVVADSLSALLSDGYSIDYRQRARRVMVELAEFARAADIAFVILHHFTKDGKVAGSPAVLDSLRVVLRVDLSPEDERVRVILQEKANGSGAEPQRYVITGLGVAAHAEFVASASARSARIAAAELAGTAELQRSRPVLALTAGTAAPPADSDPGPFAVLCLVRRDRCPDANIYLPGEFATREDARAAAAADAGAVLTWRALPDREAVHVARYAHPDGSDRVYGVRPGTARPSAPDPAPAPAGVRAGVPGDPVPVPDYLARLGVPRV